MIATLIVIMICILWAFPMLVFLMLLLPIILLDTFINYIKKLKERIQNGYNREIR